MRKSSGERDLYSTVLKWFLMQLSGRPGKTLAILHHLLPHWRTIIKIFWFSSGVNAPVLMVGSTWLRHRSRHCFGVREPIRCATSFQLLSPTACTTSTSRSDSSLVHWPFLMGCDARNRQRERHATMANFPSGKARLATLAQDLICTGEE